MRIRSSKFLEYVVGAVVMSFVLFLSVSLFSSFCNLRNVTYFATIEDAGGLNPGTLVYLSGVKIGELSKIPLKNDSYEAVMTLSIDGSVKIPKDSIVAVQAGLLTPSTISVTVGSSDDMLKADEYFSYAEPGFTISKLVSHFLHSSSVSHSSS